MERGPEETAFSVLWRALLAGEGALRELLLFDISQFADAQWSAGQHGALLAAELVNQGVNPAEARLIAFSEDVRRGWTPTWTNPEQKPPPPPPPQPSPTPQPPPKAPAAPSFLFRGTKHIVPRTLAAHMAREWDAATALIQGPGRKDLGDWLKQFGLSPQLQRAMAACRGARLNADRLVAGLIVGMSDGQQSSFRDFSVLRSDLPLLARQAIERPGAERAAVAALLESGSLGAYQQLPGCADYESLDALWQRLVAEAMRRLRGDVPRSFERGCLGTLPPPTCFSHSSTAASASGFPTRRRRRPGALVV